MDAGRSHEYAVEVVWTGNTGNGTAGYRGYERAHEVRAEGKPPIAGSSDPTFRGDPTRYNPEEMLVASLSTCHMLWYLSLAAQAGVVVTAYHDTPRGTLIEQPGGSGHFSEVVLHPVVTVADPAQLQRARELHQQAHEMCFIAASVNFPVRHEPTTRSGSPRG